MQWTFGRKFERSFYETVFGFHCGGFYDGHGMYDASARTWSRRRACA
jgi:hypothetical protein